MAEQLHNLTCAKCGHNWLPRKIVPACCPKCKRYDYMGKRVPKELKQKTRKVMREEIDKQERR